MIALSFGLSCNDSERIRTLYDGMMGYMMTSWSWTKNDISIIMQGASRLQSFAASVPWEVLLWGQRCRMTRWTATYPQFHGQRLIFVSFCQLPTYICDSFLLIFETWHPFCTKATRSALWLQYVFLMCLVPSTGNAPQSPFSWQMLWFKVLSPASQRPSAVSWFPLPCRNIRNAHQMTKCLKVFFPTPVILGAQASQCQQTLGLLALWFSSLWMVWPWQDHARPFLGGCSYLAFCQEDMGTDRGLPSRQSSHEKEQRETSEMAGESDADSDWQVCELPDWSLDDIQTQAWPKPFWLQRTNLLGDLMPPGQRNKL